MKSYGEPVKPQFRAILTFLIYDDIEMYDVNWMEPHTSSSLKAILETVYFSGTHGYHI